MDTADGIMATLKELKESDKRINACMVARMGLEGLMMFPPHFKDDVSDIWDPLSTNINEVLGMIGGGSNSGLKRVIIQVLDFGVFFKVLSMSDTALIVISKSQKPLEYTQDVMERMDEACKRLCSLVEVKR